MLHVYIAETKGRAYKDALGAGRVSSLSDDVRQDAFRVYCEAFEREMDDMRAGIFQQARAALVGDKAAMNVELAATRAQCEAAEAAANAAAELRLRPVVDENLRLRSLLTEAGFDVSDVTAVGTVGSEGLRPGSQSEEGLRTGSQSEEGLRPGSQSQGTVELIGRLREACDVQERKRVDIDKQKQVLEERLAFETIRLVTEETELRWKQAELEHTIDENQKKAETMLVNIETEAVKARSTRLHITEEAAAGDFAAASAAAAMAVRAEAEVIEHVGKKLAMVEIERAAHDRAALGFEQDKLVHSRVMRNVTRGGTCRAATTDWVLNILLREDFFLVLMADAKTDLANAALVDVPG